MSASALRDREGNAERTAGALVKEKLTSESLGSTVRWALRNFSGALNLEIALCVGYYTSYKCVLC